MDAANQQKILGYFIEEAKEHLETLAEGLMDLSKVISDPEEINELFRAAHSVKGGSAMLGYNSIQRTAHRLEDCFKILKEHDIPADSKLESLFLKGYDTLHTLIDQLESPFGLRDEEADKITAAADPDFAELEAYLNQLVNGVVPAPAPVVQAAAAAMAPEQAEFSKKVTVLLKEMLTLFKQKPSPAGRKELQKRCVRLAKLAPQVKPWQRLTKACHQAVANPKFGYRTLAPVVIQELKQGSDRLALKQGDQVKISPELRQLATAKVPQILIPVEPKAAARTLLRAFDKQQVGQLVKLLSEVS
ncbi:Hpt domain-containing protein [Spirulina sp. CCNP1310]|uniref:Hpt domain-containing protein n=1 Tax=Spirulina sp. CCNP1310 TaxID=3110249 RepID=UPI002B21842B|nr:Hpt domain-containing protein [Spirulina sp. CCNP1310]MEA5418259.1 Hpt domain-containing protein [Spirulina sp. CCNP1310]